MVTAEIPAWIKSISDIIEAIDPLLRWLVPIATSILGFAASAYWTERRANQRFFLEKNHEVITQAYDEIIRALNDQVSYFKFECDHFGDEEDEIPETWRRELFQKHQNASRVLSRAMQLGSLYISASGNEVLRSLQHRDQPNPDEGPEIDFFESELANFERAFNEMMEIAKLELKRPSSASCTNRSFRILRTRTTNKHKK
ncbi:MAG: hypothetical protein QM769_14555 [Pseudoxanthomonas sp.]